MIDLETAIEWLLSSIHARLPVLRRQIRWGLRQCRPSRRSQLRAWPPPAEVPTESPAFQGLGRGRGGELQWHETVVASIEELVAETDVSGPRILTLPVS